MLHISYCTASEESHTGGAAGVSVGERGEEMASSEAVTWRHHSLDMLDTAFISFTLGPCRRGWLTVATLSSHT